MKKNPSDAFALQVESAKLRHTGPGVKTTKTNGVVMAQEKQQNLQDTFLNHLRKTKVPVTVFLVNGVKLQGIITWFDNFSMLLRRDGVSQLVYKHAISTIMPGAPISLFEDENRD